MISFESNEPFYSLISQYLNFISAHNIDSHKISGFYHCDVIECRDAGIIGINDHDFDMQMTTLISNHCA